jgi:chitin disaccharide deacetylase
LHIDDAGMCHEANLGTIEAVENGVATSLSIMFPCSWTPEIVRYVKEHPNVDAGLHVTLTSEWKNYRWASVAGRKQTPGLCDKDGYMWPGVLNVVAHASADEVETEIRSQLELCRKMGVEPTHLDTHMGTVFANPLFLQRYTKVAIEMGIPVMLPGGHVRHLAHGNQLMAVPLQAIGRQLWDAGLPVLDDLWENCGAKKPEQTKSQIIKFLRTVEPGVTQLIVHCTRPGESFKNISGSGPNRLAELESMLDPDVKRTIAEEKIILTTWRELKQKREEIKGKN